MFFYLEAGVFADCLPLFDTDFVVFLFMSVPKAETFDANLSGRRYGFRGRWWWLLLRC